jgi:hypothetical protein
MKFKIDEYTLNTCKKFANDSVYSSLDKYADRHGFDVNDASAVERALTKFSKDIVIGKVGEEFVYRAYREKFPNLTLPDYEIYSVKNKSWAPDLKDENFTLAVKSQDIKSKIDNDESWTFQSGSNGRDTDKEVFDNANDNKFVALVSLNIPKRTGEIKAVVRISWLLKNKMFQPMKIERLQSNKTAVYFDDLLKYKDDLWQL